MKITKKSKFISTHSHKKTWHILLGVSLNEQKIKNNKKEKPFQYAHIWNRGFINEYDKSKYNILYTGILAKKSQKIYIHIANFKDIVDSTTMRNLYLFNKNTGNDIWECLYFSNEFQEYKNKYIVTNDCKVKMKNIFYALIGSQYE